METHILANAQALGEAAGKAAAQQIKEAIAQTGAANIILATGTSQFETLNQLINEKEIDWSVVTMFHLDEYIGLPITHKASFRKYLSERFLDLVTPLKTAHLIDGEGDPEAEAARLGQLIAKHPIDVALVGIGENGHLAFNDPPADFNTEKPYLVVNLDGPCRTQQYNEGWFPSVADVPQQAISMSVQQIMKAKQIICSVPNARKAQAVKDSLQEPVSNLYPASILQQHTRCRFYLDNESASLL